MRLCVYIYMCMYMFACVFMYMHMRMYMRLCVYKHMFICIYVCVPHIHGVASQRACRRCAKPIAKRKSDCGTGPHAWVEVEGLISYEF